MTGFVLAAVPFVMKIVMAFWVLAALILVFIVLIQKGKGGGLSAAFGGIGSSLLGTKTGDFLTWITISMASLFIVVALVLDKWWRPSTNGPALRTRAPITSNDTGRGTGQPAPAAPAQEQPAPQDQQGQPEKQ